MSEKGRKPRVGKRREVKGVGALRVTPLSTISPTVWQGRLAPVHQSGFRVQGLGFKVCGLGFRVEGFASGVQG